MGTKLYDMTWELLRNDYTMTLPRLMVEVMALIPKENYDHTQVKAAWREFQNVERSREWIRVYCATTPGAPDMETLMETAKKADWYEDYLLINGTDAHGDIPDEFWYHHEKVTGIKTDNPPKSFTCSC